MSLLRRPYFLGAGIGASQNEPGIHPEEHEAVQTELADIQRDHAALKTELRSTSADLKAETASLEAKTQELAAADEALAAAETRALEAEAKADEATAALENAPQHFAAQPQSAPAPIPTTTYFKNCTAARAAGAAPVYRGDPGYGAHLDRDGDGIGCE